MQKENAIANCTKNLPKTKQSGAFKSVFALKKVPDFLYLFSDELFCSSPFSIFIHFFEAVFAAGHLFRKTRVWYNSR